MIQQRFFLLVNSGVAFLMVIDVKRICGILIFFYLYYQKPHDMNVGASLLIWLIILAAVYFLARYWHIKQFSSVVLAILVAAIVLSIVKPANQVSMTLGSSNFADSLYWLIMFLSPIIILIYVVAKAVTDTEPGFTR